MLEDEQWAVVLISQPAAAAVLSAHRTTAALGCACYTTSHMQSVVHTDCIYNGHNQLRRRGKG